MEKKHHNKWKEKRNYFAKIKNQNHFQKMNPSHDEKKTLKKNETL